MNNLKKLFSLILALSMILTCFTVLAEETNNEAVPTPVIEPVVNVEPLVTMAPEIPVATVNGEIITAEAVNSMYDSMINQYAMYGYDTSDTTLQSQIYDAAIDSAIQEKVILLKAAELKLSEFTEEEKANITSEAEARWMDALNSVATQDAGLTDDSTEEEKATAYETAKSLIAQMGYTEDSFIDNAFLSETFNRVEDYITKDVAVSDEDVQSRYEDLVAQDKANYENNIQDYEFATSYQNATAWYVPEGFHGIKHILLNVDEDLLSNYNDLKVKYEEQISNEGSEAIETESPAETDSEIEPATTADEDLENTEATVTMEDVDAAKQAILNSVSDTINEINDKIASGTSFDDLISEYGNDPGMQSEPYKTDGYPVHKDSTVYDPTFTDAAALLENIGDISEPVVSSFGVHILTYSGDIASGAVALTDDNKSEIESTLLSDLNTTLLSDTITAWTDEFEIVKNEQN